MYCAAGIRKPVEACLWVATPLAYILSRWDDSAWNRWVDRRIPVPLLAPLLKRARLLIDSIVDIPIVLPPLVVGLCLLILGLPPSIPMKTL